MISTKTLLKSVVALISLDVILTLIAVVGMGAPELNPLPEIFGFAGFMAIKIILSSIALLYLYKIGIPSAPTATRYGAILLAGWFAAVCASNTYHIVGAVI